MLSARGRRKPDGAIPQSVRGWSNRPRLDQSVRSSQKESGEPPVGLAGVRLYPRERVNGPLTHDPKNDREDKSNCSKAEYVARERSAVTGAEPVDPGDHHRPPQGGSLPNTGRLGKFLLPLRVLRRSYRAVPS